jgi:hypothetical protein
MHNPWPNQAGELIAYCERLFLVFGFGFDRVLKRLVPSLRISAVGSSRPSRLRGHRFSLYFRPKKFLCAVGNGSPTANDEGRRHNLPQADTAVECDAWLSLVEFINNFQHFSEIMFKLFPVPFKFSPVLVSHDIGGKRSCGDVEKMLGKSPRAVFGKFSVGPIYWHRPHRFAKHRRTRGKHRCVIPSARVSVYSTMALLVASRAAIPQKSRVGNRGKFGPLGPLVPVIGRDP